MVGNKRQKKKIGIIGFGRFGRLAAHILSRDHEVKVFHPKPGYDEVTSAKLMGVSIGSLKEVAGSDIVILAVPINKTESVIRKISGIVKPGALVADTCSVKKYPCGWLEANMPENVEIVGTHPMFGPVTTRYDCKKGSWDLAGKQLVLCPLRASEDTVARFRRYFENKGLEVIFSTPEEHDRQNAYSLALVHYIGRVLWESGAREQKIYTPGYTDLLNLYNHTIKDSWELFYDMHNFNPYSEDVRADFLDCAIGINRKIMSKSRLSDIPSIRHEIDRIDDMIVSLLGHRFEAVKKISSAKKMAGIGRTDKARESQIIRRIKESKELDDDFAEKIFKLIFKESKKTQI